MVTASGWAIGTVAFLFGQLDDDKVSLLAFWHHTFSFLANIKQYASNGSETIAEQSTCTGAVSKRGEDATIC